MPNNEKEQTQPSHLDNHQLLLEIKADVKLLKSALYGMGNPQGVGLVSRVKTLEDWVDNQKWFQRLVVASIVGQIITLGVAIIVLLVKYVPQIP